MLFHNILFKLLIETFIPQAASRRLDDLIDREDDDLYRSSSIGATNQVVKDFRSQVELKTDHESRPLWITSGRYSMTITNKNMIDFLNIQFHFRWSYFSRIVFIGLQTCS